MLSAASDSGVKLGDFPSAPRSKEKCDVEQKFGVTAAGTKSCFFSFIPFQNRSALLGGLVRFRGFGLRLLNLPFAATLVVLVLGLRPSMAQNFGPISVPGTSVIFGPDNVLTEDQLTELGSNGPLGATPAVKALAFPARDRLWYFPPQVW